MNMEAYEQLSKQLQMYRDLDYSEQQITEGKTKDAKKALSSMRERHGI